jgi:hypothetical protein
MGLHMDVFLVPRLHQVLGNCEAAFFSIYRGEKHSLLKRFQQPLLAIKQPSIETEEWRDSISLIRQLTVWVFRSSKVPRLHVRKKG